ncbi:MAG: hypothetical protein QW228_01215 [Candidatus Aenigmatarchaeota archaeon]
MYLVINKGILPKKIRDIELLPGQSLQMETLLPEIETLARYDPTIVIVDLSKTIILSAPKPETTITDTLTMKPAPEESKQEESSENVKSEELQKEIEGVVEKAAKEPEAENVIDIPITTTKRGRRPKR